MKHLQMKYLHSSIVKSVPRVDCEKIDFLSFFLFHQALCINHKMRTINPKIYQILLNYLGQRMSCGTLAIAHTTQTERSSSQQAVLYRILLMSLPLCVPLLRAPNELRYTSYSPKCTAQFLFCRQFCTEHTTCVLSIMCAPP